MTKNTDMKTPAARAAGVLRRALDWLVFALTGKGRVAAEAIDDGLLDYGGQGRDEYGK